MLLAVSGRCSCVRAAVLQEALPPGGPPQGSQPQQHRARLAVGAALCLVGPRAAAALSPAYSKEHPPPQCDSRKTPLQVASVTRAVLLLGEVQCDFRVSSPSDVLLLACLEVLSASAVTVGAVHSCSECEGCRDMARRHWRKAGERATAAA